MNSANTTTSYGVDTREDVLSRRSEKQAAATSSHDFEDISNPWLLENGGEATIPLIKSSHENPKAFANEILGILGRGEAGAWLLSSQLLAGKLPGFEPQVEPWKISPKETLAIAMSVLENSSPNSQQLSVALFRQLASGKNPRIDLRCLSPEESDILANEVRKRGPMWVRSLAALIYDDRLPNFNPDGWPRTHLHSFINELIHGEPDNMELLEVLIRKNKVSNFVIETSEEFTDFCFSQGPSGIALLQVLMVKGKISNLDPSKFSREEAKAFADKLSKYGQSGNDFLTELIEQGKFPSLVSLENTEATSSETNDTDSESWCSVCARQISMIWRKAHLGIRQMAVNVAHRTLEGVHRIWQTTVNVTHMGAHRTWQMAVNVAHRTLERVRRIWQPKVVGQADMTLEEARRIWQTTANEVVGQMNVIPEKSHRFSQKVVNEIVRQTNMPIEEVRRSLQMVVGEMEITPEEACEIWQRMANEVAVNCFDTAGNVDVKKIKVWMNFFGNEGNFAGEPSRFIPCIKFMCSQMYRVCECLLNNKNNASDLLNTANSIIVWQHGQFILDTVSQGRRPPLKPAAAILASLFTPHRQKELPTCAIDSLINEEIQNYPERLIQIYIQMLSGNQFIFPSGCAIQQQQIVDGSISIDLKNGGEGRDIIFEDIESGDRTKIDQRIAKWRLEGIEYVKSADPAEKYKLKMSIHNMNDVLFVHFLLASNFGNKKIDRNDDFDTMLIYAGHRKYVKTYSSDIRVDGSNFLNGIETLKRQAEVQRRFGRHYMRVATKSTSGIPINGHNLLIHAENIDIDTLLTIDPNNMEPGKAYAIGDRNNGGYIHSLNLRNHSTNHGSSFYLIPDISQDIPHLAIRKMGKHGPYEFGTLRGSTFQRTDISDFWFYTCDIKFHDAPYWEQFGF